MSRCLRSSSRQREDFCRMSRRFVNRQDRVRRFLQQCVGGSGFRQGKEKISAGATDRHSFSITHADLIAMVPGSFIVPPPKELQGAYTGLLVETE
ncbi:hypothetical protein PoB_000284100 [Plakobranchus ocellatus]|uniref:Uncharacterized protein n=1 Tax=Plakobranchus ocellatus TaxID=259542 RepID=A0AAV3XZS6_9GAST|nr:hypothetical protein PoB_000284100 [Plakobranchus ocellatus]